ncbi:MAG: hypothetical protein ABJR46_18570 [Tateyamaria sp.]
MTTLRTLKDAAARAEATLLHDLMGAAALIVMMIVGLYLPALI